MDVGEQWILREAIFYFDLHFITFHFHCIAIAPASGDWKLDKVEFWQNKKLEPAGKWLDCNDDLAT